MASAPDFDDSTDDARIIQEIAKSAKRDLWLIGQLAYLWKGRKGVEYQQRTDEELRQFTGTPTRIPGYGRQKRLAGARGNFSARYGRPMPIGCRRLTVAILVGLFAASGMGFCQESTTYGAPTVG